MDALHFPRHLHRLHEFHQEGQWYVADLDAGVVLPTPEPIREILTLCESCTQTEIVAELEGTFGGADLERAFLLLEALDARGFLFAGVKDILPQASAKRMHLCVSPNFLSLKPQTHFLTRWVHYNLLASLAKHADVSLILPKLRGEQEEEISFLTEAVERIPVSEWAMHALLKAVPSDCDGVLLLSPLSRQDLMWYRALEVPVISYLQSETFAWREEVNLLIQHATVMRDFDALVGDAPWLPSLYRGAVEKIPAFSPLFPGTDNLPVLSASDKAAFWEKLQDQFPDKALGREALVGMLWGPSPAGREWLLPELCATHPNWTFVTCHPLARRFIGSRLLNLLCLDLFTHEDLMVFAAFISQMDVFIYHGAPGVPILPLLMALAADCPCLVDGEFGELVKEPALESCLSLLEPHQTVESLSAAIRLCLAKRQTPGRLGGFSWEGMAQGMVHIFQQGRARLSDKSEQALPQPHSVRQLHRAPRDSRAMKPVFHYHYVKNDGAVEVAAHLLPDFSNVSIEEALKLALGGKASPNEIQVVLKRLCQ